MSEHNILRITHTHTHTHNAHTQCTHTLQVKGTSNHNHNIITAFITLSAMLFPFGYSTVFDSSAKNAKEQV